LQGGGGRKKHGKKYEADWNVFDKASVFKHTGIHKVKILEEFKTSQN